MTPVLYNIILQNLEKDVVEITPFYILPLLQKGNCELCLCYHRHGTVQYSMIYCGLVSAKYSTFIIIIKI